MRSKISTGYHAVLEGCVYVTPKTVRYTQPDRLLVAAYSHAVCCQMAETVDITYSDPAVISGLADFLSIVAAICTSYANRMQGLSDEEADE